MEQSLPIGACMACTDTLAMLRMQIAALRGSRSKKMFPAVQCLPARALWVVAALIGHTRIQLRLYIAQLRLAASAV